MANIKNTHTAKIALLSDFMLSPGQERYATGPELARMNKPVLLGLVREGKLAAPELEEALAALSAPVAEPTDPDAGDPGKAAEEAAEQAAKEAQAEADRKAAEAAKAAKADEEAQKGNQKAEETAKKPAAKKSGGMPTPSK